MESFSFYIVNLKEPTVTDFRRTRKAGTEQALTLAMIDTEETQDPTETEESGPMFTLESMCFTFSDGTCTC